ncbi:GNAT family N-acetyltransferase [Coralliovum pocilloporae]|uniref:GNAT family N-acetyltransferase n=1 Tax=Coralliovum pocilloporae TaxID=3066369 RepID=UPI003306C58C
MSVVEHAIAGMDGQAADARLAESLRLGQTCGLSVSLSRNFHGLEGQWGMVSADAIHTPFQEFDWLENWLSEYDASERPEPIIVMLRDNETLVGILPLCLEKKMGATVLGWMGGDISDYCAPILARDWLQKLTGEDLDELLKMVAKSVPETDAIALCYQPDFLSGLQNPFVSYGQSIRSGESHCLELNGPWSDYYPALRSSKTRRRLQQKWNRLSKRGVLSFRTVRGSASLKEAMDKIIDWKIEQLDARGSRNPFRSSDGSTTPLRSTITRYVTRRGSGRTRPIRIYGLFLDDEMIAGYVTFTEGGRVSVFINAYAADQHTDCSPGQLLMVKILELAVRAGQSSFDLMRGGEPYKIEWCRSHHVLTDNLKAYSALGILSLKMHLAKKALKNYLLARPELMNILQSGNRLVGGRGN